MHGLDALHLQRCFQIEVEIGRIDADEEVRARVASVQQALFQLLADAENFAVMAQHFDIAAHGQFFAGPPGVKAPADHLRAAYAARCQGRPARFQAVEQQAGEQVAGGFARHQRNAGRCC